MFRTTHDEVDLRRVDPRTGRFSLGSWQGLSLENLAGGQTFVFGWGGRASTRVHVLSWHTNEIRTTSSIAIAANTFTPLHRPRVEYIDAAYLRYQILPFRSSKRTYLSHKFPS